MQLRIEPKAYEVPMSEIRRIASPDGRYELLLASTEMRMSHWVTSAALWEHASQRLLLQLGDGLWSSEEMDWSADSRVVTVGLRRYPGDAPGIVLAVYLEQQIVIPRAPAETQPLAFAELNSFLERYYTQHRRGRP
ncbi:MAG TPA: hypothetical protein PKD53_24080 [Chloroflexaceae bacterium]|nr:hypothetical protein [Chloroflexaceae bacterium]